MTIKKYSLLVVISASCLMANVAYADTQTVSIGYAQSKVKDFKDIRGINIQYRYEWNSPLSVLASFSYMVGKKEWRYIDHDSYHEKNDLKNYSLLVGPAYRINQIVSFYGLIGLSYTKNTGYYQWINSAGGDRPDGHLEVNYNEKSVNIAYGVGVIINPIKNISVNVGYQGTRANIGDEYIQTQNHGNKSINGFVVSLGYSF